MQTAIFYFDYANAIFEIELSYIELLNDIIIMN